MREDFVTRLQIQLREAAEREAHEVRPGLRDRLPRPAAGVRGAAIGLAAAALLAVAVALVGDAERPAPIVDRPPRVVETQVFGQSVSDVRGAFGSAWLYDGTAGNVLRVDPVDRRVVARIPAPQGQTGLGLFPFGSGLIGGRTDGTSILRYEPGTGRLAYERPVPAGTELTNLFDLAGRTWAGTASGVRAFDPASGRFGRAVRVPDGGFGFSAWTALDGVPWAARRDGTLLRLDPGSWRVTREIAVRGMSPPFWVLAAPGGGLLVASKLEIRRIDPESGRTAWALAPSHVLHSWELIGNRLWYAVSGPGLPSARLVKADAVTGRPLGRVSLPLFDVHGIARVGTEIWVTGNSGRVVMVRP